MGEVKGEGESLPLDQLYDWEERRGWVMMVD